LRDEEEQARRFAASLGIAMETPIHSDRGLRDHRTFAAFADALSARHRFARFVSFSCNAP